MLEAGASMEYKVNEKPVNETLKKQPLLTGEVHEKHKRWRRLRKFLKL